MGMREDFLRLPPQEQHKVLLQSNADYAALPDKEKFNVIGSVNNGDLDIERMLGISPQIQTKSQKMDEKPKQNIPDWIIDNPKLAGLAGAAYAVAKPVVEIGGLIGGGVAGSGASPIAGTVAGATLGYAGAKRFTKAAGVAMGLEDPETLPQAIVQAGKDIKTGAEMEMGGQIGGKVIGGGVNLLSKGYKAGKNILASPKARAGAILKEERSVTEPFKSNVKQAEKIQEEVPNLQLTYGQKSDFPPAIRGENISARKENIGAIIFKKLEAGNQNALRAYIKNRFPEQENIDAVVNVLKPQLEKLRATQKLSQNMLDNMIADMPNITKEGIQQGGKTLRTTLNDTKLKTWGQAQELYQKIDDVPITSSNILKELEDYTAAAVGRGDAPATIPSQIVQQLSKNADIKNIWGQNKQFTQVPTNNFNQLRGLRGQLFKIASNTTDYQLANNARQMGQIIDKGMESEAKKIGGEIWQNFKTAQEFYNKEYVGKFRLGTVGNILKAGKDAVSRYSKADSEVIGEFFRGDKKGLERIADLTNTLDKEKTGELIKDYAIYDFKNSVINKATGEVIPQKLANWYAKHEAILNHAGIGNEFKTIAQAQKIADTSATAVSEFEKSIAGKMLEVEPNFAIQTAFAGRGGKDAGIKATELFNMVKNNPAAIKGLQNSFKDFLISQVENAGKDVAGEAMLSTAKTNKIMSQYMPAIRVLWKNEPEKIKALNVFQEAVNIVNRNKTSQFAGSQTSEYQQAMQTAERFPFMGYQGVLLRFFVKAEETIGRQKVNQLVTQGRFDPNFADHLIRIARQTEDARNFEAVKKIMDRIANLSGTIPVSGGKAKAAGQTLSVYGIKQAEEQNIDEND